MNIVSLAIRLEELSIELEELEIDMFSDDLDLEKKEDEKKQILEDLLFFSKYEELYNKNEELEIDNKLLYPFLEIINENGEKEFIRKDSEAYKEDIKTYIEELTFAFENGQIDQETFDKLKQEAEELANDQLDKIEEEEKEQEEEIDLAEEHTKILESIEETKSSFIIHQIGEESYSSLCYKYKNMQEIERKELLYKTHTGLCNEMGIKCDLDFTKYDLDEDKTVNKDGYCIKTKDINNIPFPLDTILLEQTFKLYIKELLNNQKLTPNQRNDLVNLLYKDLSLQKELILERIKKRELKPYGC